MDEQHQRLTALDSLRLWTGELHARRTERALDAARVLRRSDDDALYRAVLGGDLAKVRDELARGADVNARNDDNRWTVLMVAVAEGFHDVVAELLQSPAIDVNARAERELTALHVAAERGDERAVELLLAHPGVDPNAKDNLGRTPLIIAAFAGDAPLVERLLAHPAIEVNAVDRDRQTALAWAALGGDADVVRELLADPRTNPGITNRPDERSALQIAEAAGNEEAVRLLRAAAPGEDRLAPGDVWEPRAEPVPQVRTPLRPDPPEPRGHRHDRARAGGPGRGRTRGGVAEKATPAADRSPSTAILTVQRAAGNRATLALLQRRGRARGTRSCPPPGSAGRRARADPVRPVGRRPGRCDRRRRAPCRTRAADRDVEAGDERRGAGACDHGAQARPDRSAVGSAVGVGARLREAEALVRVRGDTRLGDPALIDSGPRAGTRDAARLTQLVNAANRLFDRIATGAVDMHIRQVFGAANVATAKTRYANARTRMNALHASGDIVTDRSGYNAEAELGGLTNSRASRSLPK